MAVTQKYYDTLNCTITPDSKDTVYIHGDESSTTCTFGVNLSDYIGIYSNRYWNIPTRVGYDLVIKTIFLDYDTLEPKKIITTTIKDFSDIGKIGYLAFDFKSFNKDYTISNYYYTHKPGKNGWYGAPETFSSDSDFYLSYTGKNQGPYTINGGGSDWVYNEKGNNNYHFLYPYLTSEYPGSEKDTVLDLAGNDSYQPSEKAYAEIYDVKGNDRYASRGLYAYLDISDYSGNDYYESRDNGRFYAYDYKGNDKYNFFSNLNSWVYDYKGNDKYYFYKAKNTSSSNDIRDFSGKDYYEIVDSHGVDIRDDAGNDKYIVKDCTQLSRSYWETDLYINDIGQSNDIYKYDFVRFSSLSGSYNIDDDGGNDKYSLNDVKNLYIYDYSGNDKYTVSGQTTEGIKIEDRSGKDIYNFAGTEDYRLESIYIDDDGDSDDKYSFKFIYNDEYNVVKDEGGNDTYSLQSCKETDIYDESGNDKYSIFGDYSYDVDITDDDGKDTYNIKGSYDKKNKVINWVVDTDISDYGDYLDTYNMLYANVYVYDDGSTKDVYNIKSCASGIDDAGGNDVYNVSGLLSGECIGINDYEGSDILNLGGVKKSNIVLMANINESKNYIDNSLILYDKKSQGFVRLDNFYKQSGGYFYNYDDGQIETIKAGGKKIDTSVSALYFNCNAVKEQIASFLNDSAAFSNVYDVLISNNEGAKEVLCAIFEGKELI